MSDIIVHEEQILKAEETRVTLRNNLRAQGIVCSDDETIDSLVEKVEGIQHWYQYIDKSLSGVIYNTTASVVPTFEGFSHIETIAFNNATSKATTTVAKNCTSLKKFIVPRMTNLTAYTLENDSALVLLDIGLNSAYNDQRANGPNYSKLIMRNRDGICALGSVNYLSGTKFRTGGGLAYVPNAMISNYENATNWSSLGGTTFVALEGSRFEDLDWYDKCNSTCTLDGNEIEVLDNETVATFKHTENIEHVYENGVELQDTDLVKDRTLTTTI